MAAGLFGVYFLLGGYVAFATATWPFFMPPQLDAVAFLLRIFGEPAVVYLGGGLLVLLGGTCLYFAASTFFDTPPEF